MSTNGQGGDVERDGHDEEGGDRSTELTTTSSDALRRLRTNLQTTERLLERGDERFVRFFTKYPEHFQFLISRHYPLSLDLLADYSKKWDWGKVSLNENIDWREGIIRKFEDQLDWRWLSENPALPWTESFIREHQEKWWWMGLSANEALPWSEELIRTFQDRWDWKGSDGRIWENGAIKWTKSLLEYAIDYRNEQERAFMVQGEKLARNDSIDWTPAFAEWLFQKIEISTISFGKVASLLSSQNRLGFDMGLLARLYAAHRKCGPEWARHKVETHPELWTNLSYNPDLAWTRDLVERHEGQWFWRQLSLNPGLPWTTDLLESYRWRWDWGWQGLSRNPELPWTEEFVERYSSRLNWFWLSRNPGLPWSASFIGEKKERLHWAGLSENEGVPWTEEIIATYEDQWDWTGGKDGGTVLDDTGSVDTTLEGDVQRRRTSGLSKNPALPWSPRLLDRYSERWGKMNADTLEAIWETGFESEVTDETIRRTMSRINEGELS